MYGRGEEIVTQHLKEGTRFDHWKSCPNSEKNSWKFSLEQNRRQFPWKLRHVALNKFSGYPVVWDITKYYLCISQYVLQQFCITTVLNFWWLTTQTFFSCTKICDGCSFSISGCRWGTDELYVSFISIPKLMEQLLFGMFLCFLVLSWRARAQVKLASPHKPI